jgi:serine/threonine protein kinase
MSFTQTALQSEGRTRIGQETAVPAEFSLPRGFEPIELAGIGAFAEVWKTVEIRTGRTCALKRLRPELCGDATARRILRNESQACQHLVSRHVPKIVGGDPHGEVPYLAFEWLNGRTLEDELTAEGPLSLRRAVWMARQCADGMRDLECAGLAHGDIKPQNLFLTIGGELKLLDLGFVRSIVGSEDNIPADGFAGTPEYMAPESLCDAPSKPVIKDLYSLGITLYRSLSGRLPFVGETAAEVMEHQRQTRPTLLRRYRPDVPRELADLVSRMLAKQPMRRPQNLRSLIRELVDIELTLLSGELVDGVEG